MGNCQAVDTAALVVQHPNGKSEKLYWPVSASEVMRTNPGHHVALLISSSSTGAANCPDGGGLGRPVRVTRIKLLRPIDTLVLGQVYRLVPTQEVMKGVRSKKCGNTKKNRREFEARAEIGDKNDDFKIENTGRKKERQRQRESGRSNHGGGKSRSWQPSLQSISESAS